MSQSAKFDAWTAGDAYEQYMGRWSRLIAEDFIEWLAPPAGATWLDVGCGTGVLTETVLRRCEPRNIFAVEPAAGFRDFAGRRIDDPRVSIRDGDAENLPVDSGAIDIVCSGLVLNFVPDPVAGLREMRRVLKPDGLLSFYVWDYPGGGMGFIDVFWKAAAEVDRDADALDQSELFSMCTPQGLEALCTQSGFSDVEVRRIEAVTEFPDFDAFWHPFTLGAGPAPAYCVRLDEDRRQALRHRLSQILGGDRPIRLPARAWAVRARLSG